MMQILTNLRNARQVWGECSQQYAVCRQVAEAYLLAHDATSTSDLEDMMGQMERLGVGDRNVGGGRDV